MRAATSVGMVFVGSAQHREQRAEESDFKPRVIPPSKDGEAMHLAYTKAIAEKAAFWKEEIETLAATYGEEAVKNLKGLLNE